MNRKSSWLLQQNLKKKNQDSKKSQNASDISKTFINVEVRQGKADAEMLLEKKN